MRPGEKRPDARRGARWDSFYVLRYEKARWQKRQEMAIEGHPFLLGLAWLFFVPRRDKHLLHRDVSKQVAKSERSGSRWGEEFVGFETAGIGCLVRG